MLFICERCGEARPMEIDNKMQTVCSVDFGEGPMRWCVECQPPLENVSEMEERAMNLADEAMGERLKRPVTMKIPLQCDVCGADQTEVVTARIDDPLDEPYDCKACGMPACYLMDNEEDMDAGPHPDTSD